MRILVAEDSADNRELLMMLLQSRGHSVTGVSNGREVLAALNSAPFELIFMDEEMPIMNGVEATRAIRERSASLKSSPMIIGVSGNTTEEDEKRCLAAGMDMFLAKPVGMHAVFQLLDFLMHRSTSSAHARTGSEPADSPPDKLAEHLHRTTGGNEKILQSVLQTFLADGPKNLSTLRHAIARKNAEVVGATAHLLKGSLGIVGAKKAAGIAANLQALGRSGDLMPAATEFRALEHEFNRVRQELLGLRSTRRRFAKSARKLATKSGPRDEG
jgi:CheY-like chemotaxis protein